MLKKIIYIAQRKTKILSNFANSSQVISTSIELAKLHNNFELFILKNENESKIDFEEKIIEKYQNINFKIHSINNSIFFKTDLVYGFYMSMKLLFSKSIFYTRQDWVAFFLVLFNKNVFFEAHDFNEKRKCLRLMKKFISSRKNFKIITISEALKEKFREKNFKNLIYVIHDGVDIDFYRPMNQSQAREDIGLDQNSKVVLYSGALRKGRGISKIIEIAKIKRDVEFLIFGGRNQERLDLLKQKSKDLSNIHFFGFVDKDILKKYMDTADIFIMPHQKNCEIIKFTSPLKMFEYLAMGKPIVASKFLVFKEVLRNDFNALLVQPESQNDFAEKIDILFNDRDKYDFLSRNALITSKEYSWEKRAVNILKAINEKN